MIKILVNIYLTDRVFYLLAGVVTLFVFGFIVPFLFPVAQILLALVIALLIVDGLILFGPNVKLTGIRHTPPTFSLGDENRVRLVIENKSALALDLKIIDEIPIQFQDRNFSLGLKIGAGNSEEIVYHLRPVERGRYEFGLMRVFGSSVLGLLTRRFNLGKPIEVPVYPSVVQMKRYELKAISSLAHFRGIRKIRRLGHSYEFEQIKNYVRGDDYRSINWKATGKRGDLMVNQYEDERAQQVYQVIDKSRAMKMPFDGLSLLDHSINTSLVMSNIALQKHDKAGLITFSDKLGTTLRANSNRGHLHKILEALYREEERPLEANYELLYAAVRNVIKGRSLIFLYSNFESFYALQRVMPILRRLNRLHLLVVIFFENSMVKENARKEATDVRDIYHQTIARKFELEKMQIVEELKKYQIQSILSHPDDLSINTINKYLELKSRGMI